jgi:hypothetical protein
MAVSCHEGTEGQVVVDVFVAVKVAEFAATGFFDEDRPGIVGAIVAGDAERNAFEIFLVGFGGLWECGARRLRVLSADRGTSRVSEILRPDEAIRLPDLRPGEAAVEAANS